VHSDCMQDVASMMHLFSKFSSMLNSLSTSSIQLTFLFCFWVASWLLKNDILKSAFSKRQYWSRSPVASWLFEISGDRAEISDKSARCTIHHVQSRTQLTFEKLCIISVQSIYSWFFLGNFSKVSSLHNSPCTITGQLTFEKLSQFTEYTH